MRRPALASMQLTGSDNIPLHIPVTAERTCRTASLVSCQQPARFNELSAVQAVSPGSAATRQQPDRDSACSRGAAGPPAMAATAAAVRSRAFDRSSRVSAGQCCANRATSASASAGSPRRLSDCSCGSGPPSSHRRLGPPSSTQPARLTAAAPASTLLPLSPRSRAQAASSRRCQEASSWSSSSCSSCGSSWIPLVNTCSCAGLLSSSAAASTCRQQRLSDGTAAMLLEQAGCSRLLARRRRRRGCCGRWRRVVARRLLLLLLLGRQPRLLLCVSLQRLIEQPEAGRHAHAAESKRRAM